MDRQGIAWEETPERAGISQLDRKLSEFVRADPNDKRYKNFLHCSHCMIFARTNAISLDKYERKALILMQVRFDGLLGFPGGIVDRGETPVEGLNRELREESGWFENEGPVTEQHYLWTHVNQRRRMVLHFYAIEVSEEKIKEIEMNTLLARDFGDEVLGTCRVPLYTMKGGRGFPAFLRNNFVGNSKTQLTEALISLKLVSPENVMKALGSKPSRSKRS